MSRFLNHLRFNIKSIFVLVVITKIHFTLHALAVPQYLISITEKKKQKNTQKNSAV